MSPAKKLFCYLALLLGIAAIGSAGGYAAQGYRWWAPMTIRKEPPKAPEPIPERGWAVIRRWDDDIPVEDTGRSMVMFIGHFAAIIIGLFAFFSLWLEEPEDDAADTD